ncbi:MAG: hypothetical protein ACOYN0_07345 [Phycisphaerales bacterium]
MPNYFEQHKAMLREHIVPIELLYRYQLLADTWARFAYAVPNARAPRVKRRAGAVAANIRAETIYHALYECGRTVSPDKAIVAEGFDSVSLDVVRGAVFIEDVNGCEYETLMDGIDRIVEALGNSCLGASIAFLPLEWVPIESEMSVENMGYIFPVRDDLFAAIRNGAIECNWTGFGEFLVIGLSADGLPIWIATWRCQWFRNLLIFT